MKPRTTRIIVIASIVAIIIATVIGAGLSFAQAASATAASASQSSSSWATASAEKWTARVITADAKRRQAVDDAVTSVSALSAAEEDADGRVGEGDKTLLAVDVTALNDRIKKAVVAFSYGDDSVVEIHQQTAAVKSVKDDADDAVTKIEKAVADETARKAAADIAAKKSEEAAAAAARAAASASASASESQSSPSASESPSASQSTDSYSPGSEDAGESVPGATYYMYVSGYCGNSGCAQSAVDNNVLAYIDYGSGLSEIAGHVNSQISSLNVGNTVRVTGSGAGLYQVTSIVWTFKGASTSDVPSGFAFQTCVGSQMKLAYAQRIG